MKRRLFQKWALLLSALFLMVSCDKDDDSTPAPTPAPTEFKATAGDSEVLLSWKAANSEDVQSYVITWTPGNGAASVASNVTTYTATGLTNGTAYSFQIKAVYSQGESEVATIQATPEAEAVVYNPVTEFQAAASYKSVVLSWTAPVAAEKTTLTGYSIQVSGSEQPIVIEDPETVTYTVGELTNGEDYTFTIVAVYEGGQSISQEASAQPVDLISGIETDAAYSGYDAETSMYSLYYVKDVDLTAVPVTISLIEGATIGEQASPVAEEFDLSGEEPVTFEVDFNGAKVAYQIQAEVDTLVTALTAKYEEQEATVTIDQEKLAITIDFGEGEINKKAIDVDITLSSNATLVAPETAQATMDLSIANAAIVAKGKYDCEASYTIECIGNQIDLPEELFDPASLTGKAIPAEWTRIENFNDQPIPAGMAVYQLPDDAYVVLWPKANTDFSVYHIGVDAMPFADYVTEYGANNTILVSGTNNIQTVFIDGQAALKGTENNGQNPMFAAMPDGTWMHATGQWDGDVFINYDAGQTPWSPEKGFTGNGFYLNPGAPNGYTSDPPHTTTGKPQCFFAYYGVPSDAQMGGFFVSGSSAYSQEDVCEAMISVGLTYGFPMPAISQVESNICVGLTINNETVINTTPEGGLSPCFAVGINAK